MTINYPMLAYVRKFTYLSAAKNSNKEYQTYGKGKHNIWGNHFFRRNLLRRQGFLCAFTWQSHQPHSWRSQFYLQRLPVGRNNVSHVWRVPLWRWLRGRCQRKRVPPARITWNFWVFFVVFVFFPRFFDGFGLIFRHPLAYLHFDNLRGDVAYFCFVVCLNHFVACRNRFVVRFFRFVVCR